MVIFLKYFLENLELSIPIPPTAMDSSLMPLGPLVQKFSRGSKSTVIRVTWHTGEENLDVIDGFGRDF
jgi:hypothetical protein